MAIMAMPAQTIDFAHGFVAIFTGGNCGHYGQHPPVAVIRVRIATTWPPADRQP
jgi:hypothetical protein